MTFYSIVNVDFNTLNRHVRVEHTVTSANSEVGSFAIFHVTGNTLIFFLVAFENGRRVNKAIKKQATCICNVAIYLIRNQHLHLHKL